MSETSERDDRVRVELTFTELTTPPDKMPPWLAEMASSIKVADNLDDVWDALIHDVPVDWRTWMERLANATFARYDGPDSVYTVYER